VVLGVGFLILPARRRKAKATLEEKVADLRRRLTAALRTEFDRAREQSGLRLTDAVAPYARFVHAEERRWSEAQQTLSGLSDRTASFLAQLTTAERKAG
jgi:ABC-type transport system involved in cytochrome bd biosynthesis fused ATPase/permease subunit